MKRIQSVLTSWLLKAQIRINTSVDAGLTSPFYLPPLLSILHILNSVNQAKPKKFYLYCQLWLIHAACEDVS